MKSYRECSLCSWQTVRGDEAVYEHLLDAHRETMQLARKFARYE